MHRTAHLASEAANLGRKQRRSIEDIERKVSENKAEKMSRSKERDSTIPGIPKLSPTNSAKRKSKTFSKTEEKLLHAKKPNQGWHKLEITKAMALKMKEKRSLNLDLYRYMTKMEVFKEFGL
jgi:hypothetical protein